MRQVIPGEGKRRADRPPLAAEAAKAAGPRRRGNGHAHRPPCPLDLRLFAIVKRIVDAKAELTLGLRVYNPNTFALPVDRVECDVLIDSRPAATSRSAHVDPLPPMGEAKVELSGRVDITAVATAMMSIGSQLPIDYVVKGTITLTDGTVLPFARKGRIPVARFDRSFGPRPQ